MSSLHEQIRTAAYHALIGTHSEEGITVIVNAAAPTSASTVRYAALQAMGQMSASEPRTREVLRTALQDADFEIVRTAIYAILARKEQDLLPALQDLQTHRQEFLAEHGWSKGSLDRTIKAYMRPE